MSRIPLPAPWPPTYGWPHPTNPWRVHPAPAWLVHPVPAWLVHPVPALNAVLILRGVGFIGSIGWAMTLVALGYDVVVVAQLVAAVAAAAVALGVGMTGGVLGQRGQ